MRMAILPVGMLALVTASWSASAGAQASVPDARIQALQQFSETQRARQAAERREAREWARRAGIPARRKLPGDRVLEIQRLAADAPPRFYITYNVDAADTVSTDELWPGGALGLSLDGTGMTVGEWDGGAIYAHPDFDTRLNQVDSPPEVSNHSTHVAGTLIAAGTYLLPEARGMAYAAELDAHDWNDDVAEMAAAAAAGLLVSNHSYGIAAGWLYIGDPEPETWWWIGGADPADVEDPHFGYYDAESATWDQLAIDAPGYLIVKAAGNDRTDIGPAPGEQYTVVDQDGNALFVSDLPRNADCSPGGYDCLPTHSVAKNILVVGAVDDVPGGYSPLTGAAAVTMAEFSGWGPTDDGRIKPDLVGNGVLLLSTWSELPFYAAAAGTSMAAPNVTGSLLLLQQHHENVNGSDQFLSAAALKALAIHTADEVGDARGPDYAHGWGLFNARTAAELISDEGAGHEIIEGVLSNGATDSIVFNAAGADTEVVATLVWADPPGTPVPLTVDAPDLMLVNDLDLRIIHNATTHEPWILDPANPANAATTGDNVRDNVEQVVVAEAGAGAYTIEVSHKGTLLDSDPQPYALIISEREPPPTGAVLVLDEGFDSGSLPDGWSVTTDSGIDWHIQTPIAEDVRYDNFTGGTGPFAMVDNQFSYITVTSLNAPPKDLSAHSAVVLKFRSYFAYDTFESIHVETSSDGGLTWQSAWSFQGFNPFPTEYVLDLSAALAGEPDARFRFRFDSEGFFSGDQWQVDDVRLEVYGGAAPDPGAMCSGADVDVQSHTFTGAVQCVATNSVQLHGGVVVADGASVVIDAPDVTLGPEFTVETGGALTVQPATE